MSIETDRLTSIIASAIKEGFRNLNDKSGSYYPTHRTNVDLYASRSLGSNHAGIQNPKLIDALNSLSNSLQKMDVDRSSSENRLKNAFDNNEGIKSLKKSIDDLIDGLNQSFDQGKMNELAKLSTELYKIEKYLRTTQVPIQDKSEHWAHNMLGINYGSAEMIENFKEFFKAQNSYAEKMKVVQGTVESIANGLKRAITPATVILASINALVTYTKQWTRELDEGFASFNRNTGLLDKHIDSLITNAEALRYLGITTQSAADSMFTLLNTTMSVPKLSDVQIQQLSQQASIMERFGVDISTNAKNMGLLMEVFRKSAGQTQAFNQKMVALGRSLGMSPKQIADAFGSSAGVLSKYGENGIRVFEGMIRSSKGLNIEMQELMSIAEGFNTYDDAASKVGRLNAILGGSYLNSIQLLNASEDERIRLLREGLSMSGKNINMLNQHEKLALMQASGVKDMATFNRMFLTSQTEFLEMQTKQATETKTMNELAQESMSIGEAWRGLMMELAPSLSFVIKILRTAVQWTASFFHVLNEKTGQWAGGIVGVVIALGGLYGAMRVGIAMLNFFGVMISGVVPAITGFFGAITGGVTSFLSAMAGAGPLIIGGMSAISSAFVAALPAIGIAVGTLAALAGSFWMAAEAKKAWSESSSEMIMIDKIAKISNGAESLSILTGVFTALLDSIEKMNEGSFDGAADALDNIMNIKINSAVVSGLQSIARATREIRAEAVASLVALSALSGQSVGSGAMVALAGNMNGSTRSLGASVVNAITNMNSVTNSTNVDNKTGGPMVIQVVLDRKVIGETVIDYLDDSRRLTARSSKT